MKTLSLIKKYFVGVEAWALLPWARGSWHLSLEVSVYCSSLRYAAYLELSPRLRNHLFS